MVASRMTTVGSRLVTVLRRGNVRAQGHCHGDILQYDLGLTHEGVAHVQRCWVLLDEGFQLQQPVTFSAPHRGWWYCDLVKTFDDGNTIIVQDFWIDIIVGPHGQPYRMLDLDEFGDAIAEGALTPADAADALTRTQRFLDRHLNSRNPATPNWPDFPPRRITDLMTHR
jgi:hypothetical protein